MSNGSQMKCAPVVLFIYRRQDTATRVMQAIRNFQPTRLFIVADGPKSDQDARACHETRRAIESMTPDCPITTIYSETNLGLCLRIKSGLDHVFSEVDQAIILEDDCVPGISFFHHCSTLLNDLAADSRIFQIGGFNYAPQLREAPYDFIASKYCLIWGWATWRRSWQRYRSLMTDSIASPASDAIKAYCPDFIERDYWLNVLRLIVSKDFSDWAAEWMFTCWLEGSISLLPKVPLVSNVGFDLTATHTTGRRPYWVQESEDLDKCRLAQPLVRNLEAEKVIFDHAFGGWHSRETSFWRFLFHHAQPLFYLLRGSPSGWAASLAANRTP